MNKMDKLNEAALEIQKIDEKLHRIICDIRVLSKIHHTEYFKKMFESNPSPDIEKLFLSLENSINTIENVFSYYTYMARKNHMKEITGESPNLRS